MNSPKNRKTSKRLSKKTLIFQILSAERGLSATQLQQRAQDAGIELALRHQPTGLCVRSAKATAGSNKATRAA